MNRMIITNKKKEFPRFLILIICVLLFQNNLTAQVQSPYKLETGKEAAIFGSGIVIGAISLYIVGNTDPLTVEDLKSVSRDNVNSFDRSATYILSDKAWNLSNYVLAINLLSPGLLLLSSEVRDDFSEFSVMYLETVLLSYSISNITKGLFLRNRPYIYNENMPLEEKLTADSRLSFFSAHASASFASAVFLSTVYSEYFPDSDLKLVVWGASLLSASFVSYLRYASGYHFPTDIITGAVVGAAIGFLIPIIHKNKDDSNESFPEYFQFQKIIELKIAL